MGRIYVDEQLTPAEFDETVDYNILSALDRAEIEVRVTVGQDSAAPVVTLIRGQVSYPGGEPLGYVREGEILPCCCVPTSDIEIRTY